MDQLKDNEVAVTSNEKRRRFYENIPTLRFGIRELRNRVTQNDVTLRVTN